MAEGRQPKVHEVEKETVGKDTTDTTNPTMEHQNLGKMLDDIGKAAMSYENSEDLAKFLTAIATAKKSWLAIQETINNKG